MRQVHRMTPNDLEHEKVKDTLYACHNYPKTQILLHFALQLAIFELQAILRQVYQMTQKSPLTPSPKFHSMITYFRGSGNFHFFTGYNAKIQSFFQSLNLKFQNLKRQLSLGSMPKGLVKNINVG